VRKPQRQFGATQQYNPGPSLREMIYRQTQVASALVSRTAIAGGVALLLVMMLGLFGSNQVAAIGSIAVVLGGIVSFGSNVSTLRQTMAAISAAEVLRSDLISRIDLRVVGDSTMRRI
jgi:hypothetical protein